MVRVPRFAELSTKNVVAQVIYSKYILSYLPDITLNSPINRQYLFNVSEHPIEHYH